MQRITFSADEELIEQARRIAGQRGRTLNQEFRDWLASYARPGTPAAEFDRLMRQLGHVRSGRRYTREERNER